MYRCTLSSWVKLLTAAYPITTQARFNFTQIYNSTLLTWTTSVFIHSFWDTIKRPLVFLLCPFSFHLISKFNQIENAVSLRNLDENTQVQHFSHRSSHFTREYSPGELRVQLHHLSCHNVQWLNFPTVSTLDIQHYFAFLFLRSACLSANWKKARTG